MAGIGVDIGPWQNIVNVGWGGDILYMIYASDGIGAFGPSVSSQPDWAVTVSSPPFEDSDWIGQRFAEDDISSRAVFPEHYTPAGAAEPADISLGDKHAILEVVGSVIRIKNDHFPDGHDDFTVLGSPAVAWACELGSFLRAYTQELKDRGPPGVPDAMSLGLYYGSTSSFHYGGAVAKLRWAIYPGTVRKMFAEVADRANEYLVSIGVFDADSGGAHGNPSTVDADKLLDSLLIRNADLSLVPWKEIDTQAAVTPVVGYAKQYDLFWDILQRRNKLAYPPDGAKPIWRTPVL